MSGEPKTGPFFGYVVWNPKRGTIVVDHESDAIVWDTDSEAAQHIRDDVTGDEVRRVGIEPGEQVRRIGAQDAGAVEARGIPAHRQPAERFHAQPGVPVCVKISARRTPRTRRPTKGRL